MCVVWVGAKLGCGGCLFLYVRLHSVRAFYMLYVRIRNTIFTMIRTYMAAGELCRQITIKQ